MTQSDHPSPTSPGKPESVPKGPVLLETRSLSQAFVVRDGWRKRSRLLAARDIDLVLRQGEAYGLVGESGSGKSTVARMIMRLLQPTSGTILFEGQDITAANGVDLKHLRENIQIVFQDPHASLNPRKTIFFSVAEPLVIHRNLRGAALRNRVAELLDTVRLSTNFLYRYPHELSGGQKQRVCIARAVALSPKLLILDEPTSALDVSVQAQILDFLRDLKARLGLTYLFISHNLSVVRYLCDRMGVMYLGRIVEEGAVAGIFARPQHPYTEALLSAVPLPQARQPDSRIVLTGDIPSPIEQPTGCAFHPRCPRKIGEVCERQRPGLAAPGDGARVACHLYVQTAASS